MKTAEEILKDNAFMNGGNTDAEKSFYAMGYKAAMESYRSLPAQGQEMKLDKFKSIIANTSPEDRKEISDYMDSLSAAQGQQDVKEVVDLSFTGFTKTILQQPQK